ncbi:hypothetical protein AAC387_Pa08g2444 [Persea americana]
MSLSPMFPGCLLITSKIEGMKESFSYIEHVERLAELSFFICCGRSWWPFQTPSRLQIQKDLFTHVLHLENPGMK